VKPLYNLNDVHIGAIRSGGTTPATALELRKVTLSSFAELLLRCRDGDVIINGDLFDAFAIPMSDLWQVIELCNDWLTGSKFTMYAARGNHDIAKNSTLMSSFDLFCKVMGSMHRTGGFVAITEPMEIPEHSAYVIPHMPNQDLFDQALKTVPKCRVLFLHANYDNKFAVEADHSLNVSPAQAEAAPVEFIIFGHEHQRKSALNGKVVVVGNQIPTSVADCLGNDAKYLLRIGETLEHLPVWEAATDFARPDWRDLSDIPATARFVRVGGEATAAEAAMVVSAISKLRSRSSALVVTNAVVIDGQAVDDDSIKMSLESVKSFDVLTELLSLLDPSEAEQIKKLMEENNVSATQGD
jgi:DNA repair exonuclease SbcCD nuclease subunit